MGTILLYGYLLSIYIERKIHVLSSEYFFWRNGECYVRNSPLHQWLFSGHHWGLQSAFKPCFVFSMLQSTYWNLPHILNFCTTQIYIVDSENLFAKVQKQGEDHNANLVLYDVVDQHLIGPFVFPIQAGSRKRTDILNGFMFPVLFLHFYSFSFHLLKIPRNGPYCNICLLCSKQCWTLL